MPADPKARANLINYSKQLEDENVQGKYSRTSGETKQPYEDVENSGLERGRKTPTSETKRDGELAGTELKKECASSRVAICGNLQSMAHMSIEGEVNTKVLHSCKRREL